MRTNVILCRTFSTLRLVSKKYNNNSCLCCISSYDALSTVQEETLWLCWGWGQFDRSLQATHIVLATRLLLQDEGVCKVSANPHKEKLHSNMGTSQLGAMPTRQPGHGALPASIRPPPALLHPATAPQEHPQAVLLQSALQDPPILMFNQHKLSHRLHGILSLL